MDRLDQAQVQAIKKLSTSRLISKLSQVGYTEDELDSMNRDTMLEQWATCVVSGTDKPVVANPSIAGYDAALEREKLDFEKRNFRRCMSLKRKSKNMSVLKKNLLLVSLNNMVTQ